MFSFSLAILPKSEGFLPVVKLMGSQASSDYQLIFDFCCWHRATVRLLYLHHVRLLLPFALGNPNPLRDAGPPIALRTCPWVSTITSYTEYCCVLARCSSGLSPCSFSSFSILQKCWMNYDFTRFKLVVKSENRFK